MEPEGPSEELWIALGPGEPAAVRGYLDSPPSTPLAAVLLAHGAGLGPQAPFLVELARELAARGSAVLRFEYPYMQRSSSGGVRRPPDRAPVLLAAQRAALEVLRARFPKAPLFLAGRSMGARMASHLAAEGLPVAGCVFLAFPLHPAGRPERALERCAHFPRIRVPTLFVQGTRDRLAPLGTLEQRLATLGHPAERLLVEGAGHDLALPRAAPRPPEGHVLGLAQAIAAWMATVCRAGGRP